MLFRLFIFFSFSFSLVYSCEYQSCKQKVIDAQSTFSNSLDIAVKKNVNLIYSHIKPKFKILKYDPFLSLYLVEKKNNFPYPFRINMLYQKNIACVDKNKIIKGKISMPQVGLNNLAIFTKKVYAPNILTSSCCFLEGIVTYEGIIQKEYLKRFIESKQSDYSDIGIRLIQKKDYIVVSASNPYIKENKFKNGDIILKYNEKKIINAAMLMRKILFSKIGSTHTFELKRNNKILKFKIKSFKRYGGGLISDTFLEQKGIFFDKNLTIIQINNKLESNGLEVGDKLLQINHTKVQTQKELRIYISNFTDFSSLLVSRDGFEFFVNLK